MLVATLLFLRQVAAVTTERNRFFLFWEPADALALIAAIVLLAGLLVLIVASLDAARWAWGLKAYDHFLLLLLTLGLLSYQNLVRTDSKLFQLALLVAVGAIGFSLGHPRSPLVPAAKAVCCIFSPLALILFVQVLTLGTWGPPPRPGSMSRESGRTAPPVLIVVFDALSYRWSTNDGEFLPGLRNLSANWPRGH